MVQLKIENIDTMTAGSPEQSWVQTIQPGSRRVLFRIGFVLMVVIGLFLLVLPQILSSSSIKEEFVAQLTQEFDGSIEVENIDLAWWKPAQLSGVTVKDHLGNALADVESAEVSVPLWSMLWADTDALVLKVRKPRFYYHLDPYGESNWDALLENSKKAANLPSEFQSGKHNKSPLQIQIIDGQVTVYDQQAERTLTADNIQARLKRSDTLVTGQVSGESRWLEELILEQLQSRNSQAQTAGSWQATFELAMADGKVQAGDVDAEVEDVPLAWLKPWLEQYAPHLNIAAADSDLKVTSQWNGNLQTGLKLAMQGTMTTTDVTAQSSQWFPEQEWSTPEFQCQFKIDNTLPTTAGNFEISAMLKDCEVLSTSENSALPDPQLKEPPVRMGDVHLKTNGVLEMVKTQLTIKTCTLTSKTSEITMSGVINNWTQQPALDFEGTSRGDVSPWLELSYPELSEILTAKRLTPSEFAIRGTLASSSLNAPEAADSEQAETPPQANPFDPQNPFGDLPVTPEPDPNEAADLEIVATINWENLNCYGIQSRQGELWTKYADDELQLVPVSVPIGQQGRYLASARIIEQEGTKLLIMPKGPVLEKISFNKSMARQWLRYVTPIVADATALEGTFSLDMTELVLDLDTGEPLKLNGALIIHDCRMGPGPLIRQLTAPIAGLSKLGPNGNGIQFLQEDAKWVDLPAQNVRFARYEDRIYHDRLVIRSGKVSVVSTGSVGLDQTLDLKIALPLDLLPNKNGPFAQFLKQQPIEIGIQGTFDQPKVNKASLKEFGAGAVDSLIQGIIERRRSRGR